MSMHAEHGCACLHWFEPACCKFGSALGTPAAHTVINSFCSHLLYINVAKQAFFAAAAAAVAADFLLLEWVHSRW
jgi:hypothetical protein